MTKQRILPAIVRYDRRVQTALPSRPIWLVRMAVVTLLVGIGSGVSGLIVSLGLHLLQHFAYGYSEGTFLEGLLSGDPWRRVWVLAIAGVIGGVGWWALRKWGRPVISIEKAVRGGRMPMVPTLINTALQIVVVGLGASVGREVAPRELGTLAAGWITEKAGVTARQRRIFVACGAAAGLAAVYNVPLGGAVFAVEILLSEISFATALPALATSAVATLVARVVVPTTPLYHLPHLTLTPSLTVWSVLAGPVIGLAAVGFVLLVRSAGKRRPIGWRVIIVMPVVFTLIGLTSVVFPAILGNGRSLGQLAFDSATPLLVIAALFFLKILATATTIGAGAAGGTLTPSLSIGASMGAATGILWSLFWPGTPIAAFAFIAASAFLASSMRAPLTAIVLLIEFTSQGAVLIIPTFLAVAGSVAVAYVLGRRRLAGAA